MAPPESSVYLLAVVEVDKADRIQCQAQGCGHSVYKRIHVVLDGLEFKVLGSQCYERLYGQTAPSDQMPQYGSGTGRVLTAEERMVLVENTAAFIEALEAERVEFQSLAAMQAARQREEELAREARQLTPAAQLGPPVHLDKDARSPMYVGGEMLRWRWKSPQTIAVIIAEYDRCPSHGNFHAGLMAAFKKKAWPSPYFFALDVELKQCLPKSYVFRYLDELNLIERAPAKD